MKTISLVSSFLLVFLISTSLAQEEHSRQTKAEDVRHSVFGPPLPPVWEFQVSYLRDNEENVSSFNFYRKDQRNKTLFFRIANNTLNIRDEFRAKELAGGAALFPINDDDRVQLDIGGTYDIFMDSSLAERALYSRVTVRPQPALWFRFGYEYSDGFTPARLTTYRKTVLSSLYLSGKVKAGVFSIVGVVGRGRRDDVSNNRIGAAGILEGWHNTFLMGGYIKSNEPKENVLTLAVGRWAPFRPDGLPSGMFIWKHREHYDFQLGGLFWGRNNLFVQPAAIGMSQGIFISSTALRENSDLRRGQLMSITDEHRNADVTVFYVYLNQGIEMIPGRFNHIGFRAVQLYKIFSEVKLPFLSNPVVGLFYNEETEPQFNPTMRAFVDARTSFWSFQAGVTVKDAFILNVVHSPKKSTWTVALSFVYR